MKLYPSVCKDTWEDLKLVRAIMIVFVKLLVVSVLDTINMYELLSESTMAAGVDNDNKILIC